MQPRGAVHLSADVLKAFGLGKLDDRSAEAVRSHLDVCADCRQQGTALAGDVFLNRLRQAHGRSFTHAPGNTLAEADRNAQASLGPTTLSNLPPELAQHPDYEVLRELGRGGMGIVYLSRHRLSGRMEVLKVMNKALLEQQQSKERFLREIQSAARLDHKNVVKMYTALELGQLMVLVMEYVPGEDLAQVMQERGPLPVMNACYYVQQAAAGLQHAFEKGMIHRDIKPQNLILARDGKKHLVKILDFGLVKATREGSVDAELTGTGVMVGTPGYVSPEQILDAATADIRADIYSLGCTLYHLLAGNPPFSGRSLFEILQAHHSVEARPLNLIRPEAPKELAVVVWKMMAKKAAQRYQTPMEVVRALEPFVQGKLKPLPLEPDAPTAGSPAVEKSAKREKPVVAASRAAPRGMAGREASATVARAILAADTILPADARQGGDGRKPRPATAGKTAVPHRSWKLLAVSLAVLLMLAGLAGLCAFLVLRLSTPIAGGYDQTAGYPLVHFGKDRTRVLVLLIEEKQSSARVYDMATGEPLTPPLKLGEFMRDVSFSPDGQRVVTTSEKSARLWDAATGTEVTPPLKHADTVWHASFSPDGQRVVTTSEDKTARLWDAATGKAFTPLLMHEESVRYASFSPDGKRVVTISGKTARLWDAATCKELTPPLKHEDSVYHASFSPDGQRVVTTSEKSARLWDAATCKELTPPLKHENTVYHASFSPDGQRVVTASFDKTARLWDAATGKEVTPPLKHAESVREASFSPDGQRVVTISEKSARLWDAATGTELTPPLKHEGYVLFAWFSPDGKRVVTIGTDESKERLSSSAWLWDAATGEELKKVAIAPPTSSMPARPPTTERAAKKPDSRRAEKK